MTKRTEQIMNEMAEKYAEQSEQFFTTAFGACEAGYKSGFRAHHDLIIKEAEKLAAVIEHAIELGYLGEGSTHGWATEALADWQRFTEGEK